MHDNELLERLKAGDESALDMLFTTWYPYLFRIAYTMLQDTDASKDCVQEVFVRFWQKREILEVQSTLKGYLQRMIVNECLAFKRRQKMHARPEDHNALPDPSPSALHHLESGSLETLIHEAIDRLPDQCALIFRMSRLEEMSYREIAEHLELSPKTVENQIGKALKLLRESLGPWLTALLAVAATPFW
jgi:RNA polymerase sigma-70 factor (ECF subfamily)